MDVENAVTGRAREINALHVPVGQSVKLIMTSQDVIHSFFVPAFRIKQDVLPGRYTTIWFQATKPGQVSSVLRRILRHQALRHDRLGLCDDPQHYQHWLQRRSGGRLACLHRREIVSSVRLRQLPSFRRPRPVSRPAGPVSTATVQLAEGATVVADETYIRQKLYQRPKAKTVYGFRR